MAVTIQIWQCFYVSFFFNQKSLRDKALIEQFGVKMTKQSN